MTGGNDKHKIDTKNNDNDVVNVKIEEKWDFNASAQS